VIEFEHPETGERERVSWRSAGWTFLFGGFYFILKGAWGHGLALLAGLALPLWLWGRSGLLLALAIWLGYVALTQPLLARHYRARGWRTRDGPPSRD
jgi:hypothetical protein